MNSYRRFARVYRTVEELYGRQPAELDIERAYKRYLKVADEAPQP